MFGIGLPELILILAIAVIVIGPEKLPEFAKKLARTINELKNAFNGVKESIGIDDGFKINKKGSFNINSLIKDTIIEHDKKDDSLLSSNKKVNNNEENKNIKQEKQEKT